jgi:hypothetical protein
LVEVDSESEDDDMAYNINATTENKSPAMHTPPYILYQFECKYGRKHVGVSLTMTAFLGRSNKYLAPTVSDDGNTLRLTTQHPTPWTSQKFHKKAMLAKGVPDNFITHIMDEEAKEFRKLALLTKTKLTKSKSMKIKTFCEIKLPFSCEQKIIYKIPITHRDTGVVSYILLLRKVDTTIEIDDDDEDEKPVAYASSDESDSDLDEVFVVGGKKFKYKESD